MARSRALAIVLLTGAMLAGPAEAACRYSHAKDGSPRFLVKGPEVEDRKTGLVWQRCSLGLAWTRERGCTGARTGYFYPDAETAAARARPWRLPTAEELGSLIDRDCGQPAIDTNIFPDVSGSVSEAAERYWTATPGGLDDMMVFMDFADGYADIHSRGFHLYVRLVRPVK